MTSRASYYAIQAYLSPVESTGLATRIVWPQGRRHSFLVLTEESGNERHTLAELHFTGKDKNGRHTETGKKPLNILASLAGYVGLEKMFHKAALNLGFDHAVIKLKGIQTSERSNLEAAHEVGRVEGPQDEILAIWNKACAAAVVINRANIDFIPFSPKATGPVNCNAGTKAVLSILGEKFGKIASILDHEEGRSLHSKIPGLYNEAVVEAGLVQDSSTEGLVREKKNLASKLFQTSRRSSP